jgi:hypothetical protein
VRPGPAVGVDGWRIRRRGFWVRHSPVEFLNMPLGVPTKPPFGVSWVGFVGFVAPVFGVL